MELLDENMRDTNFGARRTRVLMKNTGKHEIRNLENLQFRVSDRLEVDAGESL